VTDLRERLETALAGQYRLERELGRGGMATVFLAHDRKHDRSVALKVLDPDIARAIGTERFQREIQLSARLQHPHILTVLDSGEALGQLWFAMPFVEGETLAQRIERERQLPLEDALRIAREVADALQYAHGLGIIHRDIKPENILLSGSHALVTDFGIARAIGHPTAAGAGRLTETGLAVGTPQYMSPEQSSGERDLDARTDIYSLGSVVYEMLTGEPPFTGPSAQAILAKRLSEPVPHLRTLRDVPRSVEAAVTRALARSPADRFASAAEFAEALVRTGAGPRARRRWVRGLAVAGTVAAALAGALVAIARFNTAGRTSESAAVLPFLDISPAQDQEYFSDGLTEDLIAALGQIPGLRVAARTSSFQFKGAKTDVREVGQRLGVGAVVEGTVRRIGQRLRVTVELVSARDGYALWSNSYDRDLVDVFAVQEEIAKAIAAALRLRLTGKAESALGARPTADLEAYDLYLKGQFALNQRSGTTLPEAARLFEQAVTRDSGFARAWAGLADAHVLLPLYTGTAPARAWPHAKAAALRAIALDSGLVEAHTSLAYGTMLYDWDWAAAEREFKRAIATDPNYPTAHHWYGDFLAGRGRLEESLAEMRSASELDPLSRIIGVEFGWVYNAMHRFAEADSAIDRVLRLDPNFPQANLILGEIRLAEGRPREAVTVLGHSLSSGGFNAHTVAVLISAYAALGDLRSATALLDTLTAHSAREYIPPFAFAAAYAGLGDRDRAFTWLQRGVKERDVLLPENFFEPLLDPLKSDPRYQPFADRLRGGVRGEE
jgi:serine/threonine-protein kinase